MSVTALLDKAREKGVMIATAESCTGGLIAGALTDVPGSSDVFDRGFVTYSNPAKSEMLAVNKQLIAKHGAVSEEVAKAMCEGALTNSAAGMAVSVTGVAGPGGSELKPEGMVCFGLAIDGETTKTETIQFGSIGRAKVRQATVDHAIAIMFHALK